MKELLKVDNPLGDIVFFFRNWLQIEPYEYQKLWLSHCLENKRLVGIWCRQSGKSTTIAGYTMYLAVNIPGIVIIMVAPSQRQSKELYSKVRTMAAQNSFISAEVKKSTETELYLSNGSRIVSLPCGPDGGGIRGFTGDVVIVEEAGKFKDSIINSVVMPMLASKKEKGQLIKIGTPLKRNHFYDSVYKDKRYSVSSIDWKVCVAAGQYSQEFIDEQKANLTDIEFGAEYENRFIEEGNMFFPIKLLEESSEEYNLLEVLNA